MPSIRSFITLKRSLLFIVILGFIACLIFAYQFRLFERAVFNYREWKHADAWKTKSLWLPDYKVTIEAKPIAGVRKNISGLTWNKNTRTLFAVINHPSEIIELSTEGVLLNKIPLVGAGDPEALEYIGDNNYIVADERRQKLIKIHIDPTTQHIDATDAEQITLGFGLTGNKGIEGLAWDMNNQRLYAAKERDPIHIYEVIGFPNSPTTTMDIIVENNLKRDARLFVKDLSGLDFDNHYGHLLVLSDESRLIIEIDKNGKPISSLSLLGGMQKLSASIPQPEGMAMDHEDTLYLVSEPNLFYVFKKQTTGD